MKTIVVDDIVMQEARNIVDGVYAPLTGFTGKKDFKRIATDYRLADGQIWAMPIILDISQEEKDEIEGDEFIMENNNGKRFRISNIEIYEINRDEIARKLYATNDRKHPGVARLYNLKKYFVGGVVEIVKGHEFLNTHERYKTPDETRELFKNHGWENIVAFQTRNPPHRSHEFLQKRALAQVDGLLIQPVIGPKKDGDIKDKYIIDTYDILIDKYYKENTVELTTFHTYMRYAGPREAVFHAQVRKNFGCTHMIIGRDHAGVGEYYGAYDAQNIFDQFSEKELGIKVFKYNNVCYCKGCENMTPDGTCPHLESDKVYLSGTELRRRLLEKEEIPDKFMRQEIVKYLESNKSIFI